MTVGPNLDRSSPFCTDGESVGGVLHVAPQHRGAVGAEQRRTHGKLGVRRVGELARSQALMAQALEPRRSDLCYRGRYSLGPWHQVCPPELPREPSARHPC